MKIVITGPEFCGKSTLARDLQHALRKRGYASRIIEFGHTLSGDKFNDPNTLIAIRHQFQHSSMNARARFLLEAWRKLLDTSQSEIQIIEGYWYKYFVNERSHGLNKTHLDNFELKLPQPDHVYYLPIDMQSMWERKRASTAPEMKRSAFFSLKDLDEWEQFLVFQRLRGRVWKDLHGAHPEWVDLSERWTQRERILYILRDIQESAQKYLLAS